MAISGGTREFEVCIPVLEESFHGERLGILSMALVINHHNHGKIHSISGAFPFELSNPVSISLPLTLLKVQESANR